MTSPLGILAAAATALFAGAALYASLVEHPARTACGPMMAVAQFRRSVPRGAALQEVLAGAGALAAAGAWLAGGPLPWLAASAALAVAVGFTRVALRPVSRRLLDPALAPDTPEATRLLRRWGRLHLVRAALGLLALALLLSVVAGR